MRIRVGHDGLVLVLVALMLTLTGMAYATPPDPTWIAGLYDDDDFDNVVDYITSISHSVVAPLVTDLHPIHDLIALPVQLADDVVALIPLSAFGPRAPPAA